MALPRFRDRGGVSWFKGEAGMMEFLTGLGAWNWLILAVVLVLLETVIPGVHFVWFGAAATLVGVIALATGIDWQWQLLIFGILSFVTALLIRKYATSSNSPSDQPGLNERGSYYIGRTVTVAEPIENGRGKVRIGDSLWIAEGPDLPASTKVKITKVVGTVVFVEPAEGNAKFDF